MSTSLSPFAVKVYELVKQIPPGKVASYHDIARLAGSPRAARAIGLLMKHNPDIDHIPCHRVIGSDGKMHGFAGKGGVVEKIKRLKAEGIVFEAEWVDLKRFRWHKTLS